MNRPKVVWRKDGAASFAQCGSWMLVVWRDVNGWRFDGSVLGLSRARIRCGALPSRRRAQSQARAIAMLTTHPQGQRPRKGKRER